LFVTDPTKGLEHLETELAALRPTPLSPRLVDAIAEELADAEGAPLRLADRCLLAAMGAGSLAACVIVGLLTWQIMGGGAAQPSSPQQILAVQSPPAQPAAPPPATIGQYQQLLARSSDAVPEIFR
jgi:hypothetical protein